MAKLPVAAEGSVPGQEQPAQHPRFACEVRVLSSMGMAVLKSKRCSSARLLIPGAWAALSHGHPGLMPSAVQCALLKLSPHRSPPAQTRRGCLEEHSSQRRLLSTALVTSFTETVAFWRSSSPFNQLFIHPRVPLLLPEKLESVWWRDLVRLSLDVHSCIS